MVERLITGYQTVGVLVGSLRNQHHMERKSEVAVRRSEKAEFLLLQ